jgi:DNA-directed RNA polymerase specialized sigma24 family protein
MTPSDDLEDAYNSWVSSLAGSGDEPQRLDALLLRATVQIRRVLSRLAATVTARCDKADLEDAGGNAILKLYRILLRWQSASAGERPQAFRPYLNQIARNVFQDLMRKQNPSWFTMAGKVQWKLRHSARFVLTEEDEFRLCALTETQAAKPESDRQKLEVGTAAVRKERDWSRVPLEELLEALLTAIRQPVPFDALVDLSLRCTGAERSVESLDEELTSGLSLLEVLVDGASNPEQDLQDAQLLHWVWTELGELPQNQRQVCGMNLEAAVGTRLETFVLRGVADRRKYETMIQPVLLKQLPHVPPLTDPEIGVILETDAKRVSNARISSQRRIARRFLQKNRADGSNRLDPASWAEGVETRS